MGYRIIFMGTPDFALPTFKALLASKHEIVCAVTQPDRPKGRGKKLAPPPVKIAANAADIPVLQPLQIKTEDFHTTLAAFAADLFVVVAYGRILPLSMINLPPLGCLNVHGSLLPEYRGAAPIQWAVINGEKTTGVTIMKMDEGMDTGDILLKATHDVTDEETGGSLFTKLSELGASTLLDALAHLEKGTLTPIAQNHDKATFAPPLTKEMGCINWQKPAEELDCLIRGLDPWPCSYTFLKGKRMRLFSPQVIYQTREEEPGTIVLADANGLHVATGRYVLRIGEIQPEGKKRMPVESFLRGHAVGSGMKFEIKQ